METPHDVPRIRANAAPIGEGGAYAGEGFGGIWEVRPGVGEDWESVIAGFPRGGGFFVSPAAVEASLPQGEVFTARLVEAHATRASDGTPAAGVRILGAALGVRARCRLSRAARHVTMATPPTLAAGIPPRVATSALLEALARDGAADVSIGSFDAAPGAAAGAEGARVRGASRLEFRLALDAVKDWTVTPADFSSTHRRHISRGNREGWTVRTLIGSEARDALFAVQAQAAVRAEARHDTLSFERVSEEAVAPAALDAPWGRRCVGAFAGGTLMCAALLGWGSRRVFYLIGGSTREGYARGAAAWMHWQLMRECRAAGHEEYNLGGVPAAAREPGHPAHGLYRFKAAFGATPVECRNATYTIRPGHRRMHQVLAAVVAMTGRSPEQRPPSAAPGAPAGDRDTGTDHGAADRRGDT